MEVSPQTSLMLLSFVESIHYNTPATKASRAVLDCVGALAITASVTLFSAVHLSLLTSGIWIIVITELVYHILDIFGLIETDMKDHVFTPATYNQSTLTYINNHTPILTINAPTAFQAGFDHGVLMAPYLSQMISRVRNLSFFVAYIQPQALAEKLARIKEALSPEMREELRGLVGGLNHWDRENSWCTLFPLTEDELLTYQLLPDLLHFFLPNIMTWGCSTVARRCPETDQIEVSRHLDWPSFGVFGKFSHLKKQNGIVSFSMPGLLGVLTGVNPNGLFVAMNVSPPRIIIQNPTQGMPSTFLCRHILEGGDLETPALSPFHMIMASNEGALSIHYRQGHHGNERVVRHIDRHNPLITLNHVQFTDTEESNNMFFGAERKIHFHQHLARPNATLETAMRCPYVNNPLTLHAIHINMHTLDVRYNSGNAFSSSGPMQSLNLRELF